MRTYILLGLITTIGFTACIKDESKDDKEEIENYLAENNIDAIPHESGLYYIIEEEGTGTEFPDLTSDVEVKYKGYLTDSRTFDQTTNNIPLEIQLSQVIEGWQIGIPFFKVGSKGKLFIPSKLGYGNNGAGIISPGDVLIFDIEVVGLNKTAKYLEENNIEATRSPYGFYYVIDEAGAGSNPTTNSTVTVHYKGSLTDGKVFDETDADPATFSLLNVIDGWRVGIPLFKKGGKGTLYIPSYLGYRRQGVVQQDSTIIPPNATLIFDVELVDFQ